MKLPDVFTTEASDACLFMVDSHMLTDDFLDHENQLEPTLGVLLSSDIGSKEVK